MDIGELGCLSWFKQKKRFLFVFLSVFFLNQFCCLFFLVFFGGF